MIELDDEKPRLDVARVHGWLAGSYWARGIAREQLQRQIAHSHCIGAYDADGQVGFARAITDYASFAWIDDVWVAEAARRQGIARRMVRWFFDHPEFTAVRRYALVTADAHGVYEDIGFHAPLRPARWMERLTPAFEARVRAST